MCRQADRTYPLTAASVPTARHFCIDHLRDVLGAGDRVAEVIDDCGLIVSELLANAINAGSSISRVEVVVHRDHIRLSVEDNGSGTPQVQNAAPTDTHGRGLIIVEALARACGVRITVDGKQVWAELALAAGLSTIDCHLPIVS